MWAVTAAATPLIALTAWQALTAASELRGQIVVVIALFSAVLVAGEMWPIPITRGEEGGDEITVSSTFGFALLLVAPVFWTILAQSVALLIDWKVRGRLWHRLPFNVGQYALAFIASRAIYALVAGLPFTGSTMQGSPDLLAAIAGGAVFLLVNNGLVAVAVASRLGVAVWGVLAEDVSWQLMTSAPVLIGLHLTSYVTIAIALWVNRRLPGLLLIVADGGTNAAVIALNGGTLPASAGALREAGYTVDPSQFKNSGVLVRPVLPWLGDIAATPTWLPFRNVISIGDAVILIAAAVLLHVTCRSRIHHALRFRSPAPNCRRLPRRTAKQQGEGDRGCTP